MQRPIQFIRIGAILTALLVSSLAHAQTNTPQQSELLISNDGGYTMTTDQLNSFVEMLQAAMSVLRDGTEFNDDGRPIGNIASVVVDEESNQRQYTIVNESIPKANILLFAGPDPLDFSDDRKKVPIVVGTFALEMQDSVFGIGSYEIARKLDLASYWVDSEEKRHEGNDLGAGVLPTPRLHVYRYRANQHTGSRFPVDVEMVFVDPLRESSSQGQSLMTIRIERAYRYLTPEMRKQKREDEQHKKREKYGYMNLCTGMVCPESGLWEGWTKNGPTDVLEVKRGQKFDAVRSVPVYVDSRPCPMVDGQWMWLCATQQIAGFTWYGITLKGRSAV